MLFEFQKDIVKWALKKGRACIFADCGLGKTPMQLEWSKQVCNHTGGKVLIVAPLAVSRQTKREGQKFGIEVNIARKQEDVIDGINITNYEMLQHFEANQFDGIVLDESSILKHFTSKMRNMIIDNFSNVDYRLACTATPSPNDYMELGNHSEFCNVLTRTEMLSMFFINDFKETQKWRLKGHAEDVFWKWLSSWAVVVQNPSDLQYEEKGFDLPELEIIEKVVSTVEEGEKIKLAKTLTERRTARKQTIEERCRRAANLVNKSDKQWLVWCNLNDESQMLKTMINEAVEVKGADKNSHKVMAMNEFSKGNIKCLVSKPSIMGFGMNFQNCSRMIFVGLSDSYESYYQAIRRCWRFGQKEKVRAYIVISDIEGEVKKNIQEKEAKAKYMVNEMVKNTKDILSKEIRSTEKIIMGYEANTDMLLPDWRIFNADKDEQ